MKTKNRELLNRAAGVLEGLAANSDITTDWDGYIDALKAVEDEKPLIKPGRYEQIPLEECHKYECCINCIHFAMTGMSAPDGSCAKTKRSVSAYRHCSKFEEKRNEQRKAD